MDEKHRGASEDPEEPEVLEEEDEDEDEEAEDDEALDQILADLDAEEEAEEEAAATRTAEHERTRMEALGRHHLKAEEQSATQDVMVLLLSGISLVAFVVVGALQGLGVIANSSDGDFESGLWLGALLVAFLFSLVRIQIRQGRSRL